MSSWLDMIPANERQRIREKYKLSAAAYEKLREKVKGPEDLEQELSRNEVMAHLKFALETEPGVRTALKSQIEHDIAEQGIESVLEADALSAEAKTALEQGRFGVTVDAPAPSAPDHIVVYPEGNVQEKIPVTQTFSESYAAQLQTS